MDKVDVYPNFKACATSDLQPGDIFLFLDSGTNFYGLKTEDSGQKSEFVFLGPDFSGHVKEPSILPWTSQIVLSAGKSYRLDLPVEHAAWSTSPQGRPAVVLALVEGRFFVEPTAEEIVVSPSRVSSNSKREKSSSARLGPAR